MTTEVQKALAAIEGLTFSDCVFFFGVGEENPYVKAACEQKQEEGAIEIDETAVVSGSDDDGEYVSAWVWVSNEEAGLPSIYDDEDEEDDDDGSI